MDTTRKPPDHPDAMKSMGDMAHTTAVPQRLYTVEEFDRMLDSGMLDPDDRFELIEGRLVRREPVNPPHASIMARLTKRLERRLGDQVLIWNQLPFLAGPRSKPFPDAALVRFREDYYRSGLPVPADVVAVVEVSDAMLRIDRGPKLRLYAKAGIPEYWIVNVKKNTIEVHRDRHDLGYGSPTVARKGSSVAFAAFPDVTFSVEELVG